VQDRLKTQERKAHQLTITIEPPIAANEQNVLTILIWRIMKARNLGSYFLPPYLQVKAQTEAGQISRGAVAAPQHREVLEGSVLPEKKGQCE
jgi:hypothetical protein